MAVRPLTPEPAANTRPPPTPPPKGAPPDPEATQAFQEQLKEAFSRTDDASPPPAAGGSGGAGRTGDGSTVDPAQTVREGVLSMKEQLNKQIDQRADTLLQNAADKMALQGKVQPGAEPAADGSPTLGLAPGAEERLRDSIAPTKADLAAFRADDKVQEVVGDNPLLKDDEATGALMATLGNVREDPGSAADEADTNLVLQEFGLDAQETRALAQTDPIGTINKRSEDTVEEIAREADDYVADNEEAEYEVGLERDEDGEVGLRVRIVNPEADTAEERRELDDVNKGLDDVSTVLEERPKINAASSNLDGFLIRRTGSGGELRDDAQNAATRSTGSAADSRSRARGDEPRGGTKSPEPTPGPVASAADDAGGESADDVPSSGSASDSDAVPLVDAGG